MRFPLYILGWYSKGTSLLKNLVVSFDIVDPITLFPVIGVKLVLVLSKVVVIPIAPKVIDDLKASCWCDPLFFAIEKGEGVVGDTSFGFRTGLFYLAGDVYLIGSKSSAISNGLWSPRFF